MVRRRLVGPSTSVSQKPVDGVPNNLMAAGDSRELCGICQERYDGDGRQPVALQCGHSFCRPCIVNLQHTHAAVCCPNCSRIHEGIQPEALPTNYLLLNVLESISAQRAPRTSEAESDGDVGTKIYCKDTDSSDSDSDEEDCKKLKKKKEKKEEDAPKLPETPLDDDRSKLVLDVSAEEVKTQGLCSHYKVIPKLFVWGIVLLVSVVGGLLSCYVIAPSMLRSWGFSEKGPVKDSYAAQIMSETSKANGGPIPKGSWAAWYQTAGHKGFNSETTLLLFFSGFVTFGMTAIVFVSVWYIYRYLKNLCEKFKSLQLQEVPLTQTTNSPT